MKKTYTVFISSTSKDLLPYRKAVADGCLDADFHPIDMDNFMARTEDAVTACLKEVEQADLFIGIYAWRYGYVPDGADCSITEMEFRRATELNKPRLCFLIDENYSWPDEFREGGLAGRALADFKARIDQKLVRSTFTSPEDLKSKVIASLARWEREQQDRRTETPVVEEHVRQQLDLQAKIKRCEHELSELENYRMSLIRQRPEKIRTRAQRGTELYILIGIVLLCLAGAAMSIEPVFGLVVLLAAGAGVYLWFNGQAQTANKIDRQIANTEQQIEHKKQELRQLHQQITSLTSKGNN